MSNKQEPPKALKKIIDIPGDIVKDLKDMAEVSDKNLKIYIQDVLVELVRRSRDGHSGVRKN